jgi:hypothetical protein
VVISFYHLDAEVRHVTERMHAEADPETGAVPEDVWQRLDALAAEGEARLVELACVLKERRAEAEAVKAEAKKLRDRAASLDAMCERLEAVLEERVGEDGISDPRVIARWRSSKSVEVTVDPKQLPELYQRVKIEADKVGLRKAIEAGAEISGAEIVIDRHLIVK